MWLINSEGHVVDKFMGASYDAESKQYQLLVRWRGLSELEVSWEPIHAMIEDVPAAVKSFVAGNIRHDIVRPMDFF